MLTLRRTTGVLPQLLRVPSRCLLSTSEELLVYDNPLVSRYASAQMSFLFSPQRRHSLWRELWVALAQAEWELGVPGITASQVEELRSKTQDIDFQRVAQLEREFRHDVMAHIHAYGEVCPSAKGIIHLGATSCFVTDNAELILMRQGLEMIKSKLLTAISLLRHMALEYRSLPTLGFTHFQAAQLTTVGKRATLWLQDFLLDFEQVESLIHRLPLRGVKGTTGTQASFLELLEGDHDKVRALDRRVCELMGFQKSIPVSGQTYTRKLDYFVLSTLSGVAQSAQKMATDVRLLMSLKEIEEPFEKKQIGSSAMAYKRNPMRCERICALTRFAMTVAENAGHTHATQWFERTLDDSANRRLSIPQVFLAVDGILSTVCNVVDGMQVWPKVIDKHIQAELPFMATENILMTGVKAGGDRQELHEAVRELSMEAARVVKEEGKDNDLLQRIAADERFRGLVSLEGLTQVLDARNFVGRAPEQVLEFIQEEVDPLLTKYASSLLQEKVELHV